MNPNLLYAIDWSLVPKGVSDALDSGEALIMNGVARNARTFELLKHMPFRPVALDNFTDLPGTARQLQNLGTLMQGSTAAIQTALALSTALTIGAVVVATAYLASKLRDLEVKIERLEGELRGQNLLFYASKASTYFAAVEATRELIASPELIAENGDLAAHALSRLAAQRHESFAFLGNLFRSFEELSTAHQALALDFFHATLDFVPKAVFVEVQAAYKLERFRLGVHTLGAARTTYNGCLADYKTWANARMKCIIGGRGTPADDAVAQRLKDAKRIIESEENRLLLDCSV